MDCQACGHAKLPRQSGEELERVLLALGDSPGPPVD
jgi:hypothetical protein